MNCYGFTSAQFAASLLDGIHQLKSLVIHLDNGEPKMQICKLLDLIKDKLLITQLVVGSNGHTPVNSAETARIFDEHQVLIELKLLGYQFTADDANCMTQQLTSLKIFEFSNSKHTYTQLKARLNDMEWKIDGDRFSQYLTLNNLIR